MTLGRMPVFAWAMLVVGADDRVRLSGDHRRHARCSSSSARFDWPFFIAARGGDPLLWQHLFWFFGHPEVYIIFLPAAGHGLDDGADARAARRWSATAPSCAALVGVGVFSFALWAHHMFTAGLRHVSS